MLVERDLLTEIKPFLKRREYLAIIGPRQAGKTTLLGLLKRELIKDKVSEDNIKIVTFEDRRLLLEFEKDPAEFVNAYRVNKQKLYLMLDEFQYVEDGGQKLKLIYDTQKNLKIIITGSSSLDLKARVDKYMVGRMLDFTLLPFSFAEFIKARDQRLFNVYQSKHKQISQWLGANKKINIKSGPDAFSDSLNKLFEDYCVWGGYPAVVLADTKKQKQKILTEVFNKYVTKDIKDLLSLTSDKNLIKLAEHLAIQAGNIIVYKNLSNAAQLDFVQTKEHINILQETFIIDLLKPFFSNRNKELSKNPKVYFYDLGFRNLLMENFNNLTKRTDTGALIENAVWLRLRTVLSHELGKLNFWRTKVGAEVDFVLSLNQRNMPIEVKYTNFDKLQIPKSFNSFITHYESQKGLLLTKKYFAQGKIKSANYLLAPVCYFC